MTNLLFIRHAQTDLAGTFCGQSDPNLSEIGLSQLPNLLERLAPHAIDAVYTSDLRRARETAESITYARHIPLNLTPELREIAFGDWETLTWETIEQRDPTYAARWVAEFPNLPTPNGEPITQFRQRILNALYDLRQKAATTNIAVVTHAGVLRVLLEEFGHFSPHHAWERTRDYTCIVHCTQTSPESTLVIQP
ncbi:histidine phosphatase family protein [Granulicella tundricola]|uniref:Phosphoglycerate mutase n=1 Tax=Granulicella tundricola (strain ATCC BAA-1859 / DSM 23138 / MP5ACTX9) TaxID=1198114 RepID=E8X1D1_GRATM|nr:histidine phosphatase family protein [Granulicella tundricola]ADW69085.1 Phosphoglycerate mutase [Granulicella tundricola MP5ACTX9]